MTLLQTLTTASCQIGNEHFLLPIAHRDRPIKRERVYCYELYHQLRIALHHSPLTLTGEPDKRGHPDFPNINPDFIFHTPGHHTNNTAVVEVECRLSKTHLAKDLKNLKIMRSKGYQTLVLLLFAVTKVPWPRLELAAAEAEIDLGEIVVLLHRAAGESATRSLPPARNST